MLGKRRRPVCSKDTELERFVSRAVCQGRVDPVRHWKSPFPKILVSPLLSVHQWLLHWGWLVFCAVIEISPEELETFALFSSWWTGGPFPHKALAAQASITFTSRVNFKSKPPSSEVQSSAFCSKRWSATSGQLPSHIPLCIWFWFHVPGQPEGGCSPKAQGCPRSPGLCLTAADTAS